jgi:homoserine kinase type II
MNWAVVQQLWSIPEPWSIRSITQGDNNLTRVIETPSGSYIARAYRSDRQLEQIKYEHCVLINLKQKLLPFQIPIPVPTISGELFAIISDTIVTLSPCLPGSLPGEGNQEQAWSAGQALAELVKALHELKVEVGLHAAPFPPLGDFKAWAGTVLNLTKLINELPLNEEQQKRTLVLLEESQTSAPALYQKLPQQIIHRDYDQSNILMEGNMVTAVLDFEFCGYDLRILDLAYALSHWPDGLWNTGSEWPVIDAFGRGYLQSQILSPLELKMLPLVLRLRAAAGLFIRLGRFVRGLETQERLLERIHKILDNETWLQQHEDELVRHALSWRY